MYGAFYTEKQQPNGKVTYYLNPKFILGCFDAEKQTVRINPAFEETLTKDTIEKLEAGYKKAVDKTNERLDSYNIPFFHRPMPEIINEETTNEQDIPDSAWVDWDWDEPENNKGAR